MTDAVTRSRPVDEFAEVQTVEEVSDVGFDRFTRLVVVPAEFQLGLFQRVSVPVTVPTEGYPDGTDGWAEVPFFAKVLGPFERGIQFLNCLGLAAIGAEFGHLSCGTYDLFSSSPYEISGGDAA